LWLCDQDIVGFPCACSLAMKIRKNKHIQLDDINCRWQRLCMGENGISVMDEWNGV